MKLIRIAGIIVCAAAAIAQNASGEPPAAAQNAAGQTQAGAARPEQIPAPPPLEPAATGAPQTEMLDLSKSSSYDPLLQPKPLPHADLSLIGGTVRKVDTVRNRIIVQPFGGGSRYAIYFDERTRILSGGHEATALAIHVGDRVSVDTQALGAEVFAKTVQVRMVNAPAQASGQIIEVLGGQVRMQERMSGEEVRFLLTPQTQVESHGAAATSALLHSGSLIDVTFTSGKRGEARKIVIHATPGESYVFAGVLTNVDLRDGVLALDNEVDGNNYELYFDPLEEKNVARLVAGTPVRVNASFDGKRYRAEAITITGEQD
jgi:hypothetical protein